MGNAIKSIGETAKNDFSNVTGSVQDFVQSPAQSVSVGVTRLRDQETSYQMGHIAPILDFAQGKTSLGAALEKGSKHGVNADLALITGKSDNNENATVVRNTVAAAAAVLAAAYGGVLVASGSGAGMAGGATVAGVTSDIAGATATVEAVGSVLPIDKGTPPPPPPISGASKAKADDYLPLLAAGAIVAKLLLF